VRIALPYDAAKPERPFVSALPVGISSNLACREIEGGHEFEVPRGVFADCLAKLQLRDVARIAEKEEDGPQWPGIQGIILCDKLPADLRFRFALTIPKGARMDYQPALTQAEIKDGCSRPRWAVGSYVLRREFKLGHFPAPWIDDRDGRRAWGRLEWDAGVLTKVFEPGDVAGLRGPFTVDPETFGRTDCGGTSTPMYQTFIYAFQPDTDPASNGTVDSISVYTSSGGVAKWTLGLYDNDAGGPNAVPDDGATDEATFNGDVKGLQIATYSSKPSIVASTQYHIGIWRDTGNAAYCWYDAGAKTKYRKSGQTYVKDTLEDPFPDSPLTTTNGSWSIYATYTASGGGDPEGRLVGGKLVGRGLLGGRLVA